jgi:hypothetical protein
MARPARKRKKPTVDPELLRQLEAAEATAQPVEAVFTLSPEKGVLPSPDRVDELAHELVERAKRASGGEVEDMNVFRNMASFVTKADPGVVRHLLEEPGIAGGVANRRPEP